MAEETASNNDARKPEGRAARRLDRGDPGQVRARRTRPRPPLRGALGLLAGAAIALLAAAAIAAGTTMPAVSAGKKVNLPPAPLPAGQTVGSCPGPARLLEGSDAGTDPQFSPASSSANSAVSALLLSAPGGQLPGSTLSGLGQNGVLATLATPPAAPANQAPASAAPSASGQGAQGTAENRKAAVLPVQTVTGPSVLRADPLGGARTSANATMAFTANDGDLQGLAAANCQTPSNDMWLLGASTTVGRTAILDIANTSATAATINLDLYGDKGPIQAAGARGLLVPAGSTRAIVLAGLASGQQNLAVRLKSTGGPVAATIQQSVLRGLTPGGVEILEPVAAPALRQAVTGVDVQDPALAAALSGQSGYQDASSALQVALPSGSDAVVQVRVYGTGGQQSLPNGGVFTAKAGAVTELPLTGLQAGTYTLDVRSDSSFTAAVRLVHGSKAGEPVDFASAGASSRLDSGQLITLPRGLGSKLSFGVADGRARVSLTPVTEDGQLLPAKNVDVAGGTTVVVDPSQLAGNSVAGFIASATGDSVYGAQLLNVKDGVGLSVVGIPRGVATAQDATVVLGY
ncbi:MAG TPA: DUF5719 family protein [Micrococcaceae bacterium]|jgi:hypothetical protein|nr:DUF5719 family protein [Micrococcaceae bacterium]